MKGVSLFVVAEGMLEEPEEQFVEAAELLVKDKLQSEEAEAEVLLEVAGTHFEWAAGTHFGWAAGTHFGWAEMLFVKVEALFLELEG